MKHSFFILIGLSICFSSLHGMDLENDLWQLEIMLNGLKGLLATLRGTVPPPLPPREPTTGAPTVPPTPTTGPKKPTKPTTGKPPVKLPGIGGEETGGEKGTWKKVTIKKYKASEIPPKLASKKITAATISKLGSSFVDVIVNLPATDPKDVASQQAEAESFLNGLLEYMKINLASAKENKDEIFEQIKRLIGVIIKETETLGKFGKKEKVKKKVSIDPFSIDLAYEILNKLGIPKNDIYSFIEETYTSFVDDIINNWKSVEDAIKAGGGIPFGLRNDIDTGLGFASKVLSIINAIKTKDADDQQFTQKIEKQRDRILALFTNIDVATREILVEQGIDISAYISMLNPLKQAFCTVALKRNQNKEIYIPIPADLATIQRMVNSYNRAMRSVKGHILEEIIIKINGFHDASVCKGRLCDVCARMERGTLNSMRRLLLKGATAQDVIKEIEGDPDIYDTREDQLKKPIIDLKGNVEMEEGSQKQVLLDANDVVDYDLVLGKPPKTKEDEEKLAGKEKEEYEKEKEKYKNSLSTFLWKQNNELKREDIKDIINKIIPACRRFIETAETVEEEHKH